MTPAELARIQRIARLRVAQLRLAEANHARDRETWESARAAEVTAKEAVDAAAEDAALHHGISLVVDDLMEARLRVTFLSSLAALRANEATVATTKRDASRERLRISNLKSEQMNTWFDGASTQLQQDEMRREDGVRDELSARRAVVKVEK